MFWLRVAIRVYDGEEEYVLCSDAGCRGPEHSKENDVHTRSGCPEEKRKLQHCEYTNLLRGGTGKCLELSLIHI